MGFRFAVPDVAWAYPLCASLQSDGLHEVVIDTPANVGVRLSRSIDSFDAALITPVEYARHGGPLRIVPGILVSNRSGSGACRLRVRADARSILSLASDLRSTSDIFLSSLLIREKYPPVASRAKPLQIVPVSDVFVDSGADAMLESPVFPQKSAASGFLLDVYEEWQDILGSPLPLAFWAALNESNGTEIVSILVEAADRGIKNLDGLATAFATPRGLDQNSVRSYWRAFDFVMSQAGIESVDDVYRLAYEHGMLGDVPDVLFLEPDVRSGD